MLSIEMSFASQKPHAVCIPYPAQSHIKAMLKLAKLVYSRGFQITFVNTEYNHRRYLKSGGPDYLAGLPDFRFEFISDGLPLSDSDTTQDSETLAKSMQINSLGPFLELLEKIPPVACIVADGFMTFTLDAGEKLGIPVLLFWTIAACVLMAMCHFHLLKEKGFVPLKDASYVTNGYLDTVIDWIPSMEGIRLKDMTSLIQITDPDDFLFNHCIRCTNRSSKALANIVQTFDELEADILRALSSIIPQVYAIGPLQLLLDQIPKEERLDSIGYSLWKEEPLCLEWLDSREPSSVLYVNFGSIAVLSSEKVVEFAQGLANSRHNFLWIIRPDLVVGESAILLAGFLEETKDRGFTTSWCPQEEVLKHPSVFGFLTHCGWNSTFESLTSGTPMICMPFFGDQTTNSRYACKEWEVGLEIDLDFKSDDVEKVVREFMEGNKGKEKKNKAMEWKEKAEKATAPNGSSSVNLDSLVKQVLQFKVKPEYTGN